MREEAKRRSTNPDGWYDKGSLGLDIDNVGTRPRRISADG